MISPWVEHVIEWLQQRSILIEIECLLKELSRLWVKSTEHKEVALRGDHVSGVVWNVELVLDHDRLSHVVHDFVGVDELGSLFKVEDTGEHRGLKAVLELKVAGEVLREERLKLRRDLVSGSAVGE